MDARRARSALVVGSRSSWSFRNWTLSKATVLTGSDSVGAAAVERPPTATDMSVRTAAIPNAATCVRPRATKPSRLQRRRQCGASAAITQAVLTSLSANGLSPRDLFRRFAPLRSAAASGLPGCPDHRSISKSVPVRGSGRQRRPPRQCHPRRDLRPLAPRAFSTSAISIARRNPRVSRVRSSRSPDPPPCRARAPSSGQFPRRPFRSSRSRCVVRGFGAARKTSAHRQCEGSYELAYDHAHFYCPPRISRPGASACHAPDHRRSLRRSGTPQCNPPRLRAPAN